jgi:hypothetical protein
MGFFSDLVGDVLPIATTAAGFYTGNPGLIAGGLGMLAGGQQGSSAQAANQQVAQGMQFRPVGITNTFGTSGFSYDPTTGQMTGAGYALSPALQAYQNALLSPTATQQNLADVASQQALGRSYLATTPQQLAQNWLASQRELLAPSREQSWSNLNNQLFNTGRTGLSVAQGGKLQAANPEAAALANAQAMQDLQLASQAQTQGQQQYLFGQGLLSSAYKPLTTGLNATDIVEALGQQPLTLSSGLAGNAALGASRAAPYQYQASAYNPLASMLGGALTNQQLTSGIGNLFSGWNWGGTPQGAYGQQDQYLAGALSNPQTQQAQMLSAQMAGLFD